MDEELRGLGVLLLLLGVAAVLALAGVREAVLLPAAWWLGVSERA